jgi:hypothetical protein
MPDIAHIWGGDLSLNPTGDLLSVSGPEAGRQRIIRRLFSNQGDLLFHPEYGAGLPRRVGDNRDEAALRAVVLRQIFAEAAVARSPEPQVTATPIPNGVVLRILYADGDTGEAQPIGMTVEA